MQCLMLLNGNWDGEEVERREETTFAALNLPYICLWKICLMYCCFICCFASRRRIGQTENVNNLSDMLLKAI